MDSTELLLEAISTLKLNKLRTGLATLGIVIGIGSVIALISLGQGSSKAVQSQIQSLGSNLLTVIPGAQSSGSVRGAAGGATTLTYDDAQAISTSPQITTIKTVSPEFSRRTQVTTGKNNTNTQIIGVAPAYAQVRKVSISTGNFISQRDLELQSRVAVLGPQVVTDLFGEGASSIGQSIRISGQLFRVIGVTTAQKQLFGANYVSSISVEAVSDKQMVEAQDQIGYLLLARHKLNDPSQADFTIFSQNDILSAASQVTGTFTALLSGIAAISLLVGGIGIMNIMLVTVTERTREIGLRKALGAKRNIIITQFLIESVILTFAGGLIGMMIGILASYIISRFINLPFTVTLGSVVLAIGVSAAIGIVFGWYPAQRAAKLQPIEALRYE